MVATRFKVFMAASAVAAVSAAMACGGDSPTGPSGGGGGTTVVSGSTGGPGPSGATITITASGVSPTQVTIATGQSVTVVNNDTRPHEIASNPHPTHGSCPSIERGLGTIAAGQTKLTHGFSGAGTCGYHDHLNPDSSALQGRIVIQ
jgi:plastocyanin